MHGSPGGFSLTAVIIIVVINLELSARWIWRLL